MNFLVKSEPSISATNRKIETTNKSLVLTAETHVIIMDKSIPPNPLCPLHPPLPLLPPPPPHHSVLMSILAASCICEGEANHL